MQILLSVVILFLFRGELFACPLTNEAYFPEHPAGTKMIYQMVPGWDSDPSKNSTRILFEYGEKTSHHGLPAQPIKLEWSDPLVETDYSRTYWFHYYEDEVFAFVGGRWVKHFHQDPASLEVLADSESGEFEFFFTDRIDSFKVGNQTYFDCLVLVRFENGQVYRSFYYAKGVGLIYAKERDEDGVPFTLHLITQQKPAKEENADGST